MIDARTSGGVPRLEMRGIRKHFGATRALQGVDLSVMPREIMALVGENGAGKTTLMKVLSGAHPADEGRLFLDGRPYAPRNPLHARECGVAMIYQELSLAPHLTVMENILLGIEPTRRGLIDWRSMRERARTALSEVGVEVSPETEVRTLPIARQQLVEIARAVALDSRVLVLDEPTSSLAMQDIRRLFSLIRRLQARGIAVVYISHFLEEVREISDRFTVLRDGKTVGSGITKDTSVDDIIGLMVGREVRDLYPRSPRSPGNTILETRGLRGADAPVSATLELSRGEILGIAGLVGAGRTEFMRALFGLDAVVSGNITIGSYHGPASPLKRWNQKVGMVSEDRKNEGLAAGLSVADNTTLPRLDGMGPGPLVFRSRQRKACLQWIEKIPIRCQSPDQPVQTLSGGNQQKVAIARLLHADVDVLLLDEPTRGIDVGSKAQIYELIDALAIGDEENGRPPKGVLMISSYLPELLGICDRIAVMCRGRLSETRNVEDWDEHQLMVAATGRE